MRKKYFFVVLFLILVIFLSGCGVVPPINQAPIITSDPITTATKGVEYIYNVNATDPDGDTLTYSLDVKPSGMTINSANGLIKWAPNTKGDYTVIVKVSDGDLDITQGFTIAVSEPELTGIVVVPKTMTLSVGDSGVITSVIAHYSDGSTVPTALGNCTYSSSAPGVATVIASEGYRINAIAIGETTITIDYAGKADTIVVTVSEPPVVNQVPIASFIANPNSGEVPLEVSFNASNSSDNDGSIISYTWDFKDGNVGSGKIVNHTFSSAGNYNVKLTVTDNGGATGSTTKEIEVISGTIVGGIITSNTTWTIANSPYIILNEDLQIAQGATLSISEGVIVKFSEERKLKVAGALKVEGSPGSPVTLTSIRDIVCDPGLPFCSGGWVGIEFLDISDITNSSFKDAIIENANIAINLGPAGVNLNFTGNVFRNNGQAIRGGSCENATFEGNTFLDNDQALALYKGWINSNLIVKNNLFINNWSATRGKYQNTTFENNTFSNNYTVFEEGFTAENWIQNNIFENNEEVFGCYDMVPVSMSSQTYIYNNNFIDNNFVVRAPEIGCDGLTDISNNWWGTTDTNIIEDCIIDGKDDVELQIINYEPIKNTEIDDIGSPISIG